MKTFLIAGTLTLLAAAMSQAALAEHIPHRGSYLVQGAPHVEQERGLSSGKHHRKPYHKAYRKHRHHRAGPPRRVVKRHGYVDRPYHAERYDYRDRTFRHDRRHHRHRSHIPLVTVDGFPLLRIQVNH